MRATAIACPSELVTITRHWAAGSAWAARASSRAWAAVTGPIRPSVPGRSVSPARVVQGRVASRSPGAGRPSAGQAGRARPGGIAPSAGQAEPPSLRRARRHVLDCLRRDLGRVGGLQPPFGLGGLPLGEPGVLITGIAAQRARGGQPLHQRGVVQPRWQPVLPRRPWLRARTLALRHQAGICAALHPRPPRTTPAFPGLVDRVRAGVAGGRPWGRAGVGVGGLTCVRARGAAGRLVLVRAGLGGGGRRGIHLLHRRVVVVWSMTTISTATDKTADPGAHHGKKLERIFKMREGR
jgi:hypothetical protein